MTESHQGPTNTTLLERESFPTQDRGVDSLITATTAADGTVQLDTAWESDGKMVARTFAAGLPWAGMVKLARQIIEKDEGLVGSTS